jgi:rubrerythrin
MMGPVDALKIALSKENASIQLYARLSLQHKAIKELLQLLINEEEKHKQLIEDKISEMTRG